MRTKTGKNIACFNCQKIFYLPLWRLKIKGKNFCTTKCYRVYWNDNILNKFVENGVKGQRKVIKIKRGKMVACKACGKSFYRPPCLAKRKKYCGKSCFYIGKKGDRVSPETRRLISQSLRKKGSIRLLNYKIRQSVEYRLWRESVFERDNYTCQECGIRGGILNADHIKPFAYYPDLRFELSNGRTLCVPCHKMTDSYGNKARINYGNNYNNNI